ncbi:biotin--[acetyl-CoA-carboxylase] ligase [Flavobacterium sp. ASW18X]|uniref:biotin--[acetyl-CoA-carboxylase] ligase n=1 Tax=Flavobacterium sp. ASW18X TaxID=2572595 RepID=UPI0010AEBAE7|nr:biotin--[acetyl-CoA-carboxylase] ligase [Flavobacterium sp. ASW18X]TKD59047.1 biotin--[acetyl-CoA-carboxylase] ligase [Flavobacterium sp. ASW18X]
MQIIKLSATESTNLYLKQLVLDTPVSDFTLVSCDEQTQGRGQVGNTWQSEPFKNLTLSVLKNFDALHVEDFFYLNCVVSLAIAKTLKDLSVGRVRVKWPNDIMAGNKKICGILIENLLQTGHIKKSIIGIGLNVNQESFNNLPSATSVLLQTGKEKDREEVLQILIKNLKECFTIYPVSKYEFLKKEYENLLFRRGTVSTFKDTHKKQFSAVILGVSLEGRLQLQLEDDSIKDYAFKEVQLCY